MAPFPGCMLFGVTRPKDSRWGFRERKERRRRRSGGEETGERGNKSSEDRKEMDVVGELFFFLSSFFLNKIWGEGMFLNIYLFIWPHWVLVAELRIFSCSMWESRALTKDRIQFPAAGVRSLNHQTTREISHFSTTVVDTSRRGSHPYVETHTV